MKLSSHSIRGMLVLSICLLTIIWVLTLSPIPQDLAYHDFIDQRAFFSIVNFFNVTSNIAFLLVGLLGLYRLLITRSLIILPEILVFYSVFFIAVVTLSCGSAYYHIAPDNITLVWDRLPMAIGFMALFCIVLAEFISIKLAKRLFIPLIVAGLLSVIYWHYSEQIGQGDLRFYILTQFLPILVIPVILLLYKRPFKVKLGYLFLLAGYILAKLSEHFDDEVYDLTQQIISGHSLKHLAAAAAVWLLIEAYSKRPATNDW